MQNVEQVNFNVQSYIICSIIRMVDAIINEGKNHSQIDFDVNRMLDTDKFNKTWFFNGMNPIIEKYSNERGDTSVILKEDVVKEILDKLDVYENNINNLRKCSVREDANYKYQLIINADKETENHICNMQGLRLISNYLNDYVTEKDIEVGIKMHESTYLLRLKK